MGGDDRPKSTRPKDHASEVEADRGVRHSDAPARSPGGLCYEPFSGSGSQIIAGEQTGRRVCAIEISPVYVDVAVKRWQTAAGKPAVLADDGRTFDELATERLRHAA